MIASSFVRVAVPVPQLDLLTYRVPDGTPCPAVGVRVIVPLGSRVVTGIVVDHEPPPSEISDADVKDIRDVLDGEPFVPADVIDLAKWTAEYYAAGPGETIIAVLPPKTRGSRADAHKTQRLATLTAAGLGVLQVEQIERVEPVELAAQVELDTTVPVDPVAVTAKQRELLDALAGSPGGLPTAHLAKRGFSVSALARLVRGGLVSLRHEHVDRDPFAIAPLDDTPHQADRRLTVEQAAALGRLTALLDAGGFRAALLHGVTGSGKTEIYLRLAALVCASGRQSLMLVPEIALTPAIASAFRRTFGDRVAIQHSGLSDGERHDQWQRIRRGAIDVVVGTRSAVFAPVPNLGLVIVDEEHDASYKQEEAPRYNGRDVAVVRAQRAGALVVLGSATPSMESYFNALNGKYDRIVLERRVLDRPLAAVTVVDMRDEYAASGPDVILSRALVEGIDRRLERREQSLVLLNRRGFSTAVFCRQCAGTLECPNCSVSLVIHGEGNARRARCHYCNYSARVPKACPTCSGPYLEQAGFGTERVEDEVKRRWPGARVARLDRDAIRRKGALTALLSKFQRRDIDILVGTQMVAKGHDFPFVTLVGVISADVGLALADFRASERTFQLLTQVTGRAGRGSQPGEAIVQTLYPRHYSIELACRQDYRAFFDRELHFRQAMRYPPVLSVVNVVVRSRTFAGAMDDAADVAARLRASQRDLQILGPAPAPLGRLRGEYRAQLLLKGAYRKGMREAIMAAVAERTDLQRRIVIDVDPLSVL